MSSSAAGRWPDWGSSSNGTILLGKGFGTAWDATIFVRRRQTATDGSLVDAEGFSDLGGVPTFVEEAHDQRELFICGEKIADVLAKHGCFCR